MTAKNALFVTDAQLAERMGLPTVKLQELLPTITKAGFPAPDPLFENRRYWPACQAFLDRRYGLAASSPSAIPALDGEERWK